MAVGIMVPDGKSLILLRGTLLEWVRVKEINVYIEDLYFAFRRVFVDEMVEHG